MSKLTPVSNKDLIKKLKSFAFDGPFSGGNPLFMIKGTLRLTVPNPHKNIIGIDLLVRILKQAGITKDEWNNE